MKIPLLLFLFLFWTCCAAIVKKKDTFLIRDSVRHLSDHSYDWCETGSDASCWVGDLNLHEMLLFNKHEIIIDHLEEQCDLQDCNELKNCDYGKWMALALDNYYRTKYLSFIQEDYGDPHEALHLHRMKYRNYNSIRCLTKRINDMQDQMMLRGLVEAKKTQEQMDRDMSPILDKPAEDENAVVYDLTVIGYGPRGSWLMPQRSSALEFFDKRTAMSNLLKLVEEQTTGDIEENREKEVVCHEMNKAITDYNSECRVGAVYDLINSIHEMFTTFWDGSAFKIE